MCKFTALSSGSFCQIYRVTDEALIAETAVWPNFFLMNVFFALKGSKLFIIIYTTLPRNLMKDQLNSKEHKNIVYGPKYFLLFKINHCSIH